MGKPRAFPNITTSDCKKILDVIQKDLELRRKEDEQLSKIQEEVNEQAVQRNVLSKRKEFNEKYCILCCSAFNLLFRRKIRCQGCLFLVCRSCATYDVSSKAWICVVCEKQRHLDIECSTWFYNRIKQKFKLFGAAKVLETHCRKRRASDSENDSGYGHLTDVRPLQTLFSSNSSHSVSSMAGSITLEEEEDVDEEDAEIHHSIETIIEALLGSTLDDALVDHMYSHVLYYKIFSLCHGPLVKSIRNLSEALRRALRNLPHEDKDTPTVAHAALKHIISQVINECLDLPDLQLSDRNNWSNETVSHEIKGSDIFASYDSLVAAAIINKIVEEAQSKFVKQQEISVLSLDNMKAENGDLESQGTPGISIEEDFTTFDLPLKYVQVEEVEEITKEYTDSEDDKFSSISHQSSGLHSVEEFGLCKESSEIGLPSVSEITDSDKIPFPEFGRDLVEDASIAEGDSTYLPTAVTSWEENWLFRKKKRMPLYSNLKYQLLTYCDDPPYMLIPCPSESPHPVDILEYDELSELSESHSVGSLELSSESDENMGGKNNCYGSFVAEQDKKDVSSTLQTFQEIIKPDGSQNTSLSPDGNSLSVNKEQLEGAIKCEGDTEVVVKNQQCYIKEHQTTVDEDFSTAPRPGTIAEREHKKWMNAVPLKNNPYSAENIKRRFSRPQKRVLKEHASSFEEFEKEFIDTSSDVVDKQTYENKLDCGPKCIDVDLYKRDYYINELWKDESTVKRSHFNQHLPLEPFGDNHDLVTDETLNSLEEKVYISSGKVFTLENHVKRLERELKDVSLSSTDVSSIPPSLQYCSQQVLEDVRNQLANSTSEEDLPSLPSVKTLATKFNSHHQPKYVKNIENGKHNVRRFRENSKEHSKAKSEEALKVKKSKPCMKVHSLTARSLSREFRVMAHQNLPRPMNRTVSVPSQASDEFASEQESVSSVSFSSPVCESRTPVTPDIVHGYTSDESSTSTSSLPRLKVRKNISRSILQRASYWERRLEQGLLSDASVNEEFPAVDINPD